MFSLKNTRHCLKQDWKHFYTYESCSISTVHKSCAENVKYCATFWQKNRLIVLLPKMVIRYSAKCKIGPLRVSSFY